ncbi:MAG: hypothetical protein ACFCU2_06625 [Acidimicrobiia bacterium]
MSWNTGVGRTVGALAFRPAVWWEALRFLFAVRVHRGLRPSADYLHWRVHTAYGNDMSVTTPDDVVKFLDWRRKMRAAS